MGRKKCFHVLSFLFRLIHAFIHSLTHSLTHSVTHSFIHSFIHAGIRSFVHSFILSFVHSFIRSFVHSFVRSFVRSFIHSVVFIYLSTLVFFPLLLPSRHFCFLPWIVKMGFAGFKKKNSQKAFAAIAPLFIVAVPGKDARKKTTQENIRIFCPYYKFDNGSLVHFLAAGVDTFHLLAYLSRIRAFQKKYCSSLWNTKLTVVFDKLPMFLKSLRPPPLFTAKNWARSCYVAVCLKHIDHRNQDG